MTVSAYAQLRKNIITGVGSSAGNSLDTILSALKERFKEEINSPRRFEQIKSLRDLVTVLEIRDVLSEEKVEPLKVIAQSVANDNERRELNKKIVSYERSHVPREYVGYYVSENQINSPNMQGTVNHTNLYGINLSPKKRQRMIDIVIEEIGSSWRYLGRNLTIRECDIDEIDSIFTTVEKKTAGVLQKFESRADPQRWFFTLCNALHKTHRGDLVKSLQEVMTMNI